VRQEGRDLWMPTCASVAQCSSWLRRRSLAAFTPSLPGPQLRDVIVHPGLRLGGELTMIEREPGNGQRQPAVLAHIGAKRQAVEEMQALGRRCVLQGQRPARHRSPGRPQANRAPVPSPGSDRGGYRRGAFAFGTAAARSSTKSATGGVAGPEGNGFAFSCVADSSTAALIVFGFLQPDTNTTARTVAILKQLVWLVTPGTTTRPA
jgi:hypothetical protein